MLGVAANSAGLKINIGTTKTMVLGQKDIENPITRNGTQLQNVEEFDYLDSQVTWDNNCSTEIRRRIAKSHGAMTGFNTIWQSNKYRYKIGSLTGVRR